MTERWVSELTRRALTWGAWAVVVVTVLGSVPPAQAHAAAGQATQLSTR